jgi:hypothetical protein
LHAHPDHHDHVKERTPGTPVRDRDRTTLIHTTSFCPRSTATDWELDLDPEGDERLPYLFAVTRHLDGVLFTPWSLRDAEGRILISADGAFDAGAVLPKMPTVVAPVAGDEGAEDEKDREDDEPEPPTPERVARRALALAAVPTHALLEQQDPYDPRSEANRQRFLSWVAALGLEDELEPDEWEMLQRPVGRLDRQAAVHSTWWLEGLGVLASRCGGRANRPGPQRRWSERKAGARMA